MKHVEQLIRKTKMKKTYIIPAIEVEMAETVAIIAASPELEGEPQDQQGWTDGEHTGGFAKEDQWGDWDW